MGASVFISANGFICALARAYKRACTCLHVRAHGKRMQTKLRVFLRPVATSVHTCLRKTAIWSLRTQTPGPKTGRSHICTPTRMIWIFQLKHDTDWKGVRNDWNFPWLNWTQRLPRRYDICIWYGIYIEIVKSEKSSLSSFKVSDV